LGKGFTEKFRSGGGQRRRSLGDGPREERESLAKKEEKMKKKGVGTEPI
jgi:hypothetical protein